MPGDLEEQSMPAKPTPDDRISGSGSEPPGSRWIFVACAILAGFAAILIGRTWMTWINPSLDSSREFMIPARVAQGERLYVDVVAHYGPVSTWLNAAAYRTFGMRLTTPLLLLIPLAGLTFGSLFSLIRRAAGDLAAFSGTALGLSISLVGSNGGALVLPYSFGAAHSLAFSTAALNLAVLGGRTRLVAAALLWGLAIGSKPEYAVASMFAAAIATMDGEGLRARPSPRVLAACVAAITGGLALYAVALAGIPISSVILEGPLAIFDPPGQWREVYRTMAGLDHPWRALLSCLLSGLTLAGLLLGAAGLAALEKPVGKTRVQLGMLAVSGAVLGFFVLSPAARRWDQQTPPLLQAMPLFLLLLLGAWFVFPRLLSRLRASGSNGQSFAALVALVAFGGLGAVRVLLAFRYGWIATPYSSLAAPALVAAATALLFVSSPRFRFASAVFVLGLATVQTTRVFRLSDPDWYAWVRTPVGHFRLFEDRARSYEAAVKLLSDWKRPGDQLVVFPEGGLLQLACGMKNPLRQDQIMPGHLDFEAEADVILRLRKTSPRFVVLLNQPAHGFRQTAFGRDYARGLWNEVLSTYVVRSSIGTRDTQQPVGVEPFFIRIYERRRGVAPPEKGPRGGAPVGVLAPPRQ